LGDRPQHEGDADEKAWANAVKEIANGDLAECVIPTALEIDPRPLPCSD
jgi:hypothetical protein